MSPLLRRRHWIFDLDGTLTLAAHDFDAIRAELELPPGRPILESLEERPDHEQGPLRARLADIERRIALRSTLAAGAAELVRHLVDRDARLGILTRNTRDNALITLDAVGLLEHFPEAVVLGRDEAPPKPDPAGIHVHLERWGAAPNEAVMVGDFEFDLRAGREAGTKTVYVDPSGTFPHQAWADVAVTSLDELLGSTTLAGG